MVSKKIDASVDEFVLFLLPDFNLKEKLRAENLHLAADFLTLYDKINKNL